MSTKQGQSKAAFFLNLGFSILELAGGLISGSVAILADSVHDFADSISLGAGWYFEKKSEKGSNDRYSYGYQRFSLLGALINAVALLIGSMFIIYKSVNKIIHPEMPRVYWMLSIAVLGVAMNTYAAWKLKGGKSMNKQVMTIHMLEDAVGWLAVLIVSIILLFVQIPILDPILAIVINVAVLIFVFKKLIDVLKIMLQRVPKGVNVPELKQKILCIDRVIDVTHLHVWSLNKEKAVVTVHVHAKDINGVHELQGVKQKVAKVFECLPTEHVTIDVTT